VDRPALDIIVAIGFLMFTVFRRMKIDPTYAMSKTVKIFIEKTVHDIASFSRRTECVHLQPIRSAVLHGAIVVSDFSFLGARFSNPPAPAVGPGPIRCETDPTTRRNPQLTAIRRFAPMTFSFYD